MAYTIFFKQSPNYTSGSQTKSVWGRDRKIEAIAIHWWDAPERKPSFEGVVATLTNPARQASAHYVAEAGRVAQLVKESDNSWATNSANPFTISIECNPRQSSADYETIGELISDIWKRHGKIPLVPHRDYSATQCPGTYSLSKLKSVAEKYIAPTPAPKPPTATIRYEKVTKAETYVANKQPTILWDFTATTWAGMKPVAQYNKGHEINVYGRAIHPLGSVYLMTEYSFTKKNNNGFNQVDLVKKAVPPPPPPVEVPDVPPPPPPPASDPTDEESASGGERITDLERQVGLFKLFFEKIWILLGELLGKNKG